MCVNGSIARRVCSFFCETKVPFGRKFATQGGGITTEGGSFHCQIGCALPAGMIRMKMSTVFNVLLAQIAVEISLRGNDQ